LEEPIVYLYNTFQTDKYTNNYYSSYSINPVVTESSFILKEYLKRHKINSIVETTSVAKTLKENNLSYNNSYKGSRILLEKAAKNNKSLKYFLDIQIDNAGNDTKVTIANKDYATILFVVGSDFENYEANLKFANDLNDILKSINPNLKSSVSIRGGANYHGIYNEDFSSKALVIHIGGKSNTIDEVTRSINILAETLALYIKEDTSHEKEEK
ncbi:MAG: stage II sporulation protein P, partial [Bacilli bacterium]|nr:stage II sporulation protein P [Bacilli bacterium]